ncbi:MAG: hypothetical protein ACT4PV_09835 [Planctomycetaceae bacterium]
MKESAAPPPRRRLARRLAAWLGLGALLWLLVGHFVLSSLAVRWAAENLEGRARVSFAILWPWLDVGIYGAGVEAASHSLEAGSIALAISPAGLLRGAPVAAVRFRGLRGEVKEGESLRVFRAGAERGEGGGEPSGPRAPPVFVSDGRVLLVRRDGGRTPLLTAESMALLSTPERALALESTSGVILTVPYERLKTRIVSRGSHLLLGGLKIHALDGLIEGLLDIDRARLGAVNGELSWHGVELAHLARAYALPRKERLQGRLRGNLLFEGPGLSLGELKGKGGIELLDGSFESPISLKVVLVLKLPVARPSIFHAARLEFSFERSLLYLEEGRGQGTSFDLEGRGLLGFDGAVDLEVTHGSTTVAVRGTVEAPEATVLPLNAVTRPFDRLFRERIAAR